MENTIVAIFTVLALVVGLIGGAVFTSNQVDTQIVYQDKIVEKIVNVSVDKVVEIPALNQLDIAVATFLQAVEDEEDEAGNDVEVLGKYDFDEVEVSKIYDEYNVEYDGDKTTVDFRIKLRFDMEDKAAVKKSYDVTVYFEDGEDSEVEATLI